MLTLRVVGDGNTAEATISLYGASTIPREAPAIAALDTQLWVTPDVSSQLKFDGAALAGTGTLALRLSLPDSASLSLAEGAGLSVLPSAQPG
jgi:hypothetical protein